MELSPDYADLFSVFNKHNVKYLVVGAYAVVYYAEPRYTKDLDVFVSTDPANAQRVYDALREYGAPLRGMTVEDFMNENHVYQVGVAPVRVDVMMGLPHVRFAQAWRRRKRTHYGDIPVYMVNPTDLIHSKQGTGRPKDQFDLDALRVMQQRRTRRRK